MREPIVPGQTRSHGTLFPVTRSDRNEALMDHATAGRSTDAEDLIPAGCLAPWEVGEFEPPRPHSRRLLALLGPGVLLAGSAVGAGEWLFGPAVTAQYGGTFLWLATISIVLQVFFNLEVVRYTLYCGEPIFVGFFRTRPGPRFWAVCYVTLFVAHIWPFMASNAAVPLAAAMLGHLPGDQSLHWLGATFTEAQFVKGLGFVVFALSMLALVFGGTVYRMLESIMAFKLVVVLSFLLVLDVAFVSWHNVREIAAGFFRFGSVPIRADALADGRHFCLIGRDGDDFYRLQGTVVEGEVTATVFDTKLKGRWQKVPPQKMSPADISRKEQLAKRAVELCQPGRFTVERTFPTRTLSVTGTTLESTWQSEAATISSADGVERFATLESLPEPDRQVAIDLVANRGFERIGLWSFWSKEHRLPDVDWGIVAAFAGIAGAGGLSNALFSNYARDKGWGMGSQTGAIPSAVGGRAIALSHVGKVFPITLESLLHWKAWRRHVYRDQIGMWMTCSFVGMALPCMMSLEFLRNSPVSGHQVAAMSAEGIAGHFPAWRAAWWSVALFVSFLVLAPNAVLSGDLIARMWTDLLWIGSPKFRDHGEENVWRVYYSLLAVYTVWGFVALALLDPLQIATLSAVLMNVALGWSSFHTLYVNHTLLPKELRPNLFLQAGLILCGIFFLAMTLVVVV